MFHKWYLDLHIFIFFDQPWFSINNSILRCILLTDIFDAPQICGKLVGYALPISNGNISYIYIYIYIYIYSHIFNFYIYTKKKQFFLMSTNEYNSFPPFHLKMDTEPSQKCHVLKMFYFNRQWIQCRWRATAQLYYTT